MVLITVKQVKPVCLASFLMISNEPIERYNTKEKLLGNLRRGLLALEKLNAPLFWVTSYNEVSKQCDCKSRLHSPMADKCLSAYARAA